MVPSDYHTFFATCGSVAGALIGLLFVAVSVAHDRADLHTDAQRRRAGASLTVFTNALVVSLVALIPDTNLGHVAILLSAGGVAFVVASVLSIITTLRAGRQPSPASVVFVISLAVIFGFQLSEGIDLSAHPHHAGNVSDLSTLVVVCFAVGIARAWDLIGGPQVKLASEAAKLLRGDRTERDPGPSQPDEKPPPPEGSGDGD